MIAGLKKLALILILVGTGPAQAQDKMELPSHKAKEAVDKLLRAPSAVRKSLQDLSDAAKTKLLEAAGENKSTKANPETLPSPEKRSDPASPRDLSTVGRRDPFRPFTLNTRAARGPRENLSPLERYDLSQLRLVGVVWKVKEPNALVEDSVGLGYIVRVGTPIGANDGKVKAIKPDEITIEETYVDLLGTKKQREVNIKLSVEKAE
jgi:type IV pilus assembly protein PilP